MKKNLLSGLCLTLLSFAGIAQQPDTIWSLQVDSIVVQGMSAARERETTVGARTTTFSSAVLESNRTRSLSELLSDNSTVHIKSLGQGAVSTASFRGTASSHTKVNWNGITLNPSMSNTFDFSQLPVFFTDQVELQHGSGSLKNGTGALGGSINVANAPDWNDETFMRAFVEGGSFDTYTGAATIRFPKTNRLYQTRAYFQHSDNDYKYLNKVLRLEPFHERRKEAAYYQAGVMQEAYFRMKNKGMLSSSLWLMTGQRRLPQPIIVNVTNHERYRDYGVNYYIGYDKSNSVHTFSAKAAYLLNIREYRKWFDSDYFVPKEDFNRMQSLQLKADYTYTPSSQWEFGLAGRFSHDIAYTHSPDSILLSDGVTKVKGTWSESRNVTNLQAFVRWAPLRWLIWDGQFMGELNDDYFAPTFSTGLRVDLLPGHLSLKASGAYNYKFPSMNDLYWVPGGNPDLSPEKGFSYDATLTYTAKIGQPFYFKAEVSAYRMDIDNWIMWLPKDGGAIWSPININNVLSEGFEVQLKGDLILDHFRAGLVINYAYTSSENKNKNFEEDNTQYKQLPYIPLHKANARLSLEWNHFTLVYQAAYTDKRYVTQDESYETPEYTIHTAELKYERQIGRCRLTPKISVNNLFDAYYESTQYYPMPLRTISGSIMLAF